MKKCPFCAEEIQDEAVLCRYCHADLRGAPTPAAPAVLGWSPGVAGVLSFFIPGLGHIYRGEVGKGILFLLGAVIGYAVFIVPGIIIHLIAIVTAVQRPAASSPRAAELSPEERERLYAQSRKTARQALLVIGTLLLAAVVIAGGTWAWNAWQKAATASALAEAHRHDPLAVKITHGFYELSIANDSYRGWSRCEVSSPDFRTVQIGDLQPKSVVRVAYKTMASPSGGPISANGPTQWKPNTVSVSVSCIDENTKQRVVSKRGQ